MHIVLFLDKIQFVSGCSLKIQLLIYNFHKLILALPTWGQKCTVSELYLTLLSFSSKVGFSEAGTSWQNRSFLSSVNTLKTSPFGSILKMRHQSTFSGTFPCYSEKKMEKIISFQRRKKWKLKLDTLYTFWSLLRLTIFRVLRCSKFGWRVKSFRSDSHGSFGTKANLRYKGSSDFGINILPFKYPKKKSNK